jgi:integrase
MNMAVIKRDKDWWIDCYIDGRRIRRKIGPTDKVTAEKAERKLKVKAAEGKWLGEIAPDRITLERFFEQKFEPRFHGAANTKKNYRVAFNKHFKPCFGKLNLHQIKPEYIEDYKADRAKKAKASTINQELILLGSILERAVEWEYLRENPARKVKRLRVAETEYNTLGVEDANKLFATVPKNDWFYTFVVVALNTGMRVSEILALTWDDIDFKSRAVKVLNDEDHETKTGKIRYIPMNDFLYGVIKKHPRHISNSLLFASKKTKRQGEAIHRNSVESRLNQAITEAHIEGHVRIHDLRHTFGTRLADLGENPRTIMELMGHSSIEVTMRYIHTTTQRKRDAVNQLGYGGAHTAKKHSNEGISALA